MFRLSEASLNRTHSWCIPPSIHLFHSSLFFPPSITHSLLPLCCAMALCSSAAVYVALSLCALCSVCAAAGTAGGSVSLSGLLPAYDELYYRGVRAYFLENWEEAAEYIELSISTREALRKVRRKCHDECSTAGDETDPTPGSAQHSCQLFTITNQTAKWLHAS